MNQHTKLFTRMPIANEDKVDVQLNKYLEQHPYYEVDTMQYAIGHNSEQLLVVFKFSKEFQASLPEYLLTKEKGISINGKCWHGSIKPYALRVDKNGYPHFLIYSEGTWAWVSAKYFED